MHSYIKNPRIVEATAGSGKKFFIEHPQNDAILASCDSESEANEIIETFNTISERMEQRESY